MHILIIHQYFLTEDGAGGARWNEMARMWAEAGHEVTVLAGMVNAKTGKKPVQYEWKFLVSEQLLPSVRVIRCHVSQSYNTNFIGRAWAYFSFAFSSFLGGLFFAKRPDVIVATSPPLTVASTMKWLKRFRRCRAIFEVRDLWPESAIDTGVLKPGGLARLLYRLEASAYKTADWINVLTPAFEQKLIESKGVDPKKISMISNGADPDLLQPGDKNNFARQSLGLDGKFAVGYIGAHGKANRLEQVLNAAELSKSRMPDVQFVIIGDGMEKPSLVADANRRGLSNVTFVNPVPKRDIDQYINAMDVCIAVLMKNDTFKTVYPNKVFDYMCCERPIVIAIDGVARQLVEDAEAGLFAEPEDAESMLSAIKQLRQSPELCKQMGSNGRRYVLKNFSRRALAHRYLDVVARVVNQ